MKYLLSILLIFNAATLKAENLGIKNKLQFNSTFGEGFGILIKRDFSLIKVNLNPFSKLDNIEKIYIIVDSGSDNNLLLLNMSEDIRKKIDQHFGGNKHLRITGIGYETLSVSGVPGMSKSVKEEKIDELRTPASGGWGATKVFELRWFSLK